MNKFYTMTVNGEEYKMRLTASAIMQIEKKLGKPLFKALETIQDNMVETITTIIWGAMQPLNAGFTMEKATELFDDYIDDGRSLEELMLEINGLFEASGFFKKGQA
nr:MAG TPA: tail assembly chaperone [Caudoviricetes sp.]